MSRKTVPPPGEIKRLKLLVVAATAMIAVVIICGGAIGIRISGLLVDVSDDWTHYQETAHRKAIYLSDIRRAFGYGGFIHNFKNYVLRRQDRYLMLAERDMQRLQVAIVGYWIGLSDWCAGDYGIYTSSLEQRSSENRSQRDRAKGDKRAATVI